MIRRTFLRRLVLAGAGLAAGAAAADPVNEIIEEIKSQGFRISSIQKTWLGRVRIVGISPGFRREVVIDPSTGEIRRDLLVPRAEGSARPAPQLGASRGIEDIEGGEKGGDAGDKGSNWGGGWGSQGDRAGEDAGAEDGGDGR